MGKIGGVQLDYFRYIPLSFLMIYVLSSRSIHVIKEYELKKRYIEYGRPWMTPIVCNKFTWERSGDEFEWFCFWSSK